MAAVLVVVAGQAVPDDTLARALEGGPWTAHAVARAPGDLAAAIHGATDLALGL